jgi:Lhr-like helicase
MVLVKTMTADELLRVLYTMEMPFLQTNDWSRLRIRVSDLVVSTCPPANPSDVIDLLQALRSAGRVMFLPDWDRWGIDEDETDGQLTPSNTQWEPLTINSDPPVWIRRQVFMPKDLKGWFVRSRVAETTRLLFANRERFGLEAATAHLGYALQARTRPDRTSVDVASVVAHLQGLVDRGEFSLTPDPDQLKLAIQVVGAALRYSQIAAFQDRAWEGILRSVFGQSRQFDATMITAGVSSGKTFGFLLPILTLLVYRALRGEGGRNRALIIYPRTSLVEDQYHGLRDFLAEINSQLAKLKPGITLTDRPALDAGQMLAQSLNVDSESLADTLPEVARMKIEVILTTPESLKNRMLDPRAVRTYLRDVEVVVFDEIHLMEGLAGCHGIYFIRRLRQLLRDLRQDMNFEPAWVGASATVAEPVEHCARVLTLDPRRVFHVFPSSSELIRFGTFHHIFLHTRVGKPSISAVTNGIACLTHSRNDCTAFSHYVDPAAATLQARPSEQIPKTLVFVDSLSTIGRLKFTTADNEKTYEPHEPAPPYYSWFYRPAARFGATAAEVKSIGTERLNTVREWCRKCYHGIPARIDATALRSPEFAYLRTGIRMDDKAKARSTPPGFSQALQRLSGPVRNLDGCPFHEFRTCWWFSQDSGERRTIGNGAIPIDQNRAIAYTSKTDDPEIGLHDNVNDFFLTTARDLWQRGTGIPDRVEAVSTLLASPRIEVGVDFRNVRDGSTHKAMRSAASFQQKVGRVGREQDSDSLILTFLAHRPTDAHFAHQPARLIDAAHLDAIPLKSENPDVLRNHMFAAGLEFLASRRAGVIPGAGHELNIIGTGSQRVPDRWEDKVRGCIAFLGANRPSVRAFMLGATNEDSSSSYVADETIDKVLDLLGLFVADLSGAYSVGGTAAHWFKENQQPLPTLGFTEVLIGLESILDTLRQVSIGPVYSLQPAVDALVTEASAAIPNSARLLSAATNLTAATVAGLQGALPVGIATLLLSAVTKAQATAASLSSLVLASSIAQLKDVHAIIQAFFETADPNARMMQQYYFHDILTRLLPFRSFYPFGLVRTHFQHVNARQVKIFLPQNEQDVESLSTALYELLPGTWNYRWLHPRKSLCGPINQLAGTGEHFVNLSNIEGPNRAAFERTGATLDAAELPADMPAIPSGTAVPILRPVRLAMEKSANRPDARYDNELIGDDDESAYVADRQFKRSCPTLPRAFPATWYRVTLGQAVPVVGKADPNHPTLPLPHTFPAIGRVLFEYINFSTQLRTDRYVYAIDRSYGSGGIESPRIHYRYGVGASPVVIGDTLGNTDGLTFHLSTATVDTLVAATVGNAGVIRGEITIRALRRFIAQTAGCGPFQAEMIRKIILMEHLNTGGTLATLEAARVQTYLSMMAKTRYDGIARGLIDGVYAGVDTAEAATGRARQATWYDDAWDAFQSIQAAAANFTQQFVADVGRDILIHTIAVTTLDGVSRLVGAADGDLSYFHHENRGEFYIFDSVDGGNGCSETIARFLQIPPLRRILAARGGASSALPSADGFMLIEETFGTCPAQSATRFLVESCRVGVSDPADLRFPSGQVADLQARIRHEYDQVTGGHAIVEHLLQTQPSVFADWPDLLWLQVLPERFVSSLVAAKICPNLESLRSRTHLCVTGCLECVDNGDQSIYGALNSREQVSKNLLDAVRRHVATTESQAFLLIPSGMSVGAALQANSGRPVTDASGAPITAVIDENGTPRQILLTQVLSTVAPDLSVSGGALLTPATPQPGWIVNIPYLAAYRDERPSP